MHFFFCQPVFENYIYVCVRSYMHNRSQSGELTDVSRGYKRVVRITPGNDH